MLTSVTCFSSYSRSSRVSAPRERARAPADTETTTSRLSSSSPQVREECWDSELTPPTSTAPTQQHLGTEVWGESPPIGSSSSVSEWEQEGNTPTSEVGIVYTGTLPGATVFCFSPADLAERGTRRCRPQTASSVS